MSDYDYPRRVAADVAHIRSFVNAAYWLDDGTMRNAVRKEAYLALSKKGLSRAAYAALGTLHSSTSSDLDIAIVNTPVCAARAHGFAAAGEPYSRPYSEWSARFDAAFEEAMKRYVKWFEEEVRG